VLRSRIALGALVVIALVSPPPARAAAQIARDRTEALISAFKQVKPPSALRAEYKAANASAFRQLDGFLDFETLTSAPVAPRATKFSPEQMAAFRTKFKRVIRLSAYPSSGDFFREATIVVLPQHAEGGLWSVPVRASFPEKHVETVVEFRWIRRAGALKLVDLLFDGESMVAQYQRRLSRLIDKQGVAGMMTALDRRAESLVAAGK
jgi:ABC-type transporter MlaC component